MRKDRDRLQRERDEQAEGFGKVSEERDRVRKELSDMRDECRLKVERLEAEIKDLRLQLDDAEYWHGERPAILQSYADLARLRQENQAARGVGPSSESGPSQEVGSKRPREPES